MIRKLLDFFFGRVRIYAEKEYANRLVSHLTATKTPCVITSDDKKGGVYADISPHLLKKIASSLDKSGIMVYIINICGFARFSSKYRARPGILLGILLFALTLWASTLFVWRVELDGTESIPKDGLRSELAEMGVSPGRLISDIDKTTVANNFLTLHPELSWAALNFKGTTVSLTVKETLAPPEDTEKYAPMLVAKHSGVITFVGVHEGAAAVKPGTVVKKGDLLISGYVSGSGLQITDIPLLRPGNARGEVKAEVSGKLTVRTELNEIRESVTAGETVGHRFSVFGREFSFGDTTFGPSERKNLTVFGFIELPIVCETFKEEITFSETVTLTPDEAKASAKEKAYKELSLLFPDCEILKINFTIDSDESGVTAVMEYSCITEITEKKYLSS